MWVIRHLALESGSIECVVETRRHIGNVPAIRRCLREHFCYPVGTVVPWEQSCRVSTPGMCIFPPIGCGWHHHVIYTISISGPHFLFALLAWQIFASIRLSLASVMSTVIWYAIFAAPIFPTRFHATGVIGGIALGERPMCSRNSEDSVEAFTVFMIANRTLGSA